MTKMTSRRFKIKLIIVIFILLPNSFLGIDESMITNTSAYQILSFSATPDHPDIDEEVFVSATVNTGGNIAPYTCIYGYGWVEARYRTLNETEYTEQTISRQQNLGGNNYLYNGSIGSFSYATEVEYYIAVIMIHIYDNDPNYPNGMQCGQTVFKSDTQSFLVGTPSPAIDVLDHAPVNPNPSDTVSVNTTIRDLGGSYLDKLDFNLYVNDVFVSTTETPFGASLSNFSSNVANISPYPANTKVEYNITVIDNNGNVTNSKTVSYTVDGTAPAIISLDHSQNPDYTSITSITLVAVDDISGISQAKLYYRIEGETTFSERVMYNFDNDSYISEVQILPINTVVDYKVNIMDFAGNEINSSLRQYIVGDAIVPDIVEYQSDVTLGINSSYTLHWNVSDLSLTQYTIYRNGSIVASGLFTGDSQVSVPVDTSELGVFNYTMMLNDTYDNVHFDTAFVTIIDDVPLVIDSPPNFSYEYGSQGNEIIWTISDNFPVDFILYVDDSIFTDGTWTVGDLIFDIDGLDVGQHNLTLLLIENSNEMTPITVFVEVVDTVTPVVSISTPTPIVYHVPTVVLTYTISEVSNVVIYVDGVANTTSLQSGTELQFTNGMHNITIQATDKGTNIGTAEVTFFVEISTSETPTTSETSTSVITTSSTTSTTTQSTSSTTTASSSTTDNTTSISQTSSESRTTSESDDGTESVGIYGFTLFISFIAIISNVIVRRSKG